MIHVRPKLKPPVEAPESDYLAPRILPSSNLRPNPDQPHYDEVPDGPRSRSASPNTMTSVDNWIPTEVIQERRNTRDPKKLYKTEATIKLTDRDQDIATSL